MTTPDPVAKAIGLEGYATSQRYWRSSKSKGLRF